MLKKIQTKQEIRNANAARIKNPKKESKWSRVERAVKRTAFKTKGESLTSQEFVKECDVNTLLSAYKTQEIGRAHV